MCWRKGEAVADGVEDGVVDRLLVKSAPRSPRRKVEAIMAEEEVVEAIMAGRGSNNGRGARGGGSNNGGGDKGEEALRVEFHRRC
jgi:hypothetical protein